MVRFLGNKALLLLAFVLLSFSCAKRKTAVCTTIALEYADPSRIGEFLDGDIHYVALGDIPESAIAEVDKILVSGDILIIVDEKHNTINRFSKNTGEWIGQIGRYGRGKGEYLSVTDAIVADSSVYVYSNVQKRILEYSTEGEFRCSYDIEHSHKGLAVVDGQFYLMGTNESMDGYNLHIYDRHRMSIVSASDDFSGDAGFTRRTYQPFAFADQSGFLLTKLFDNTVYRYSFQNGTVTPAFAFKCKDIHEFSHEELDKGSYFDMLDPYRFKMHWTEFGHIFINGNTLTTWANVGSSMGLCMIKADLTGGKGSIIWLGEKFQKDFPYINNVSIQGYTEDEIVYSMDVQQLKGRESRLGLEQFSDLSDYSNPVVFFQKINLK